MTPTGFFQRLALCAALFIAFTAGYAASFNGLSAAPLNTFIYDEASGESLSAAQQGVGDFIPQLKPDARIRSGALDNGLQYGVMASDTPPGQAFVKLYINVGSLDEADGEEGLAHFLEHMAFNGSEKFGEDELVPMLQRLGLSFGADVNAFTTYDRTVYSLNVPKPDPELLDTALTMMREVASNLLLEQDAIDRERGIIESERRARKSPGQRAAVERLNFFFKGTKLPDRLPIGKTAVINAVSAEQMRDFYQRYYRPENAYLVVVGDIDEDDVIAKIAAMFSDWVGVGEPGAARTFGAFETGMEEVGSVFEPGLGTVVSLHGVRAGEKIEDGYKVRVENTLRQIAYSVINRRFGTLARKEDAQILGGGTGSERVFNFAEIASIQAASQPDQWEEALAVIMVELRKALDYGFDPAEIDEIIRATKISLQQAADNSDKRHSGGLANWLVSWHAVKAIPTSPEDNLAVFKDVEKLATPDALLAAIRSTWAKTTPRYFIQAADRPDDLETRYLASLKEASTVAIKANEALETADFAYTDFGPLGEVVEQRFDDRLQTHFYRFANNVRLAVKVSDWQEEQVRASVRFGEGNHRVTPDLNGLGDVISPVFTGGGLGKHSVEDMTRIFAGRTVGIGFQSGFEDYIFNGNFRPEDMVAQFQLWTAYLTDPGFRREGLAQYRRQFDTFYQNLDVTPAQVLSNKGLQHLGSGDPRYGVTPRDVLESYGIEDVKRFIAPSLTTGEIEIAVVGSVDIDAVVSATARTFGALPTRTLQDSVAADHWNAPYPDPGEKLFYHKGEKDQMLIRYLWPTHNNSDRVRNITGYLTARIISDVLRERVREELSASYSPGAGSSPSSDYIPRPGSFAINLEIAPADADQIKLLIVDVMTSLAAANGISQDALDRARAPIIADMVGDENGDDKKKSNGYWVNFLSQAQSRPDRVMLDRERIPLYEAITPDDIRAYVTTWLGMDKAITHFVVHESLKDQGAGAD